MRIFENNNINPFYNLALEEYLCGSGHDIFMIWRNEPSVIIGRFQDIYSEVNIDFINKNNIKILRRNSGGGAVYHDLGNINYSFIMRDKNYNFKYFADFIIEALRHMGINAELSGRNDIIINKNKISGMAQYRHGDIILCHGTLLYDCDIDTMERALSVDNKNFSEKLARHSVGSVKGRVVNLRPLLDDIKNINEFIANFRENILKIFDKFFDVRPLELLTERPESIEAVNLIMNKKYLNYDWNYKALA